MRRLDLLKYHDYISYIIDKLLERLWHLLRKTEDDLTARAIKHVINVLEEEKRKLWFSKTCKKVFESKKVGITDLDKILTVDKNKVLIECKFRREDFTRCIMANAFQFLTLRDLAIRANTPLFYIYEIGEYNDKWFRVVKVDRDLDYRVKRLGNGHSRDTYVVIDLDNSILMNELEFKSWLREVMNDVR